MSLRRRKDESDKNSLYRQLMTNISLLSDNRNNVSFWQGCWYVPIKYSHVGIIFLRSVKSHIVLFLFPLRLQMDSTLLTRSKLSVPNQERPRQLLQSKLADRSLSKSNSVCHQSFAHYLGYDRINSSLPSRQG